MLSHTRHQFLCATIFLVAVLSDLTSSQHIPGSPRIEDSFNSYERKLIAKYGKDTVASIYERPAAKTNFGHFLNQQLNKEVKDDMKAVRVFKKVDDVDVGVINLNPYMDSWLGILPQWKRFKKFYFDNVEAYIETHPEMVKKQEPVSVLKRPNSVIK